MQRNVNWILVLVGVLIIGLAVGALALGLWTTQFGATQVARQAMDDNPGVDRVEALIAIVDSAAYTPEERTKAVWALGQLKDPRALPVLESHYTGEPCDHERRICQYELKKAILKCRGEYVHSDQYLAPTAK